MKPAALLLLAFVAPGAFADNYATCLLDKLEGVQNDLATRAGLRLCIDSNPGGFDDVEQGAGRGIFSEYESGLECTQDVSKSARSALAIRWIGRACRQLYDEEASASAPRGLVPFNGPYTPARRVVPFEGEYEPLP